MSNQDPTADYRKYPKSPNFLVVVILFSIAILVVLIASYFLFGDKIRHMKTSPPEPTPNSLVQPLSPIPLSSQPILS